MHSLEDTRQRRFGRSYKNRAVERSGADTNITSAQETINKPSVAQSPHNGGQLQRRRENKSRITIFMGNASSFTVFDGFTQL